MSFFKESDMQTDMHDLIESYIDEYTDDVSPLLTDLLAETETLTGLARWSIGKVEGKLMQMLVKLSRTRRAVEVGTFTGYSALLIAEALPDDGILTTCESNETYAEIARKYFAKSPYGEKIRLKLGPAIPTLRSIPDNHAGFVFIDADKPSYGKYFDEALRILHSGGFIVVDNIFWRHKIFKKNITNENAKAIAAFNAKVKSEDRVEKVMLSVRDGIYLIRKK
jgi:caffeoyl-CoA O-methyltransferase